MLTRPVRGLLTVLCTAAVLGAALTASSSPAAPSPGTGRDGGPGLGDTYFPTYGNSGYRVGHYDVRVAFDPRTERLTGTTVIRARATERLTRFHLDLVLRARAVEVDGRLARFSQGRHELVVRPRQAVPAGERMVVRVRYAGTPAERTIGGYTPWVTTRDGAVAVGEPEIAAWWFPSNDHPSDRASFDVSVTAPSSRAVLGNGVLVGKDPGGRRTTWHWRTRSQMATYLAFIAIGDFRVETGRTGGFPYVYAVANGLPPGTRANAWQSLRSTVRVTRFLASRWGRYPFGPVGGVVPGPVTSGNFGYALENQTRPLYAAGFFGSGPARSVVAHEMAHQWFGDAVAVRRWKHIWLSEGFATYSEWLWSGHTGGDRADQIFHARYDNLEPASPFWNLTIGDPGRRRIFDNRVYVRGAMTAHALRTRIGDRDFFTTARRWVHDNPDGLGTSEELRRLAERVSGEQLDGLFRAWLRTARKPAATRANGVLG